MGHAPGSAGMVEPIRDPETGAWQYPPSWSAEDREAHASLMEDLAAEERAVAKAETDRATAAVAPATLLAAQRARLAETKRQREAAETEAADDAVWLKLCEQYGEARLRRIYTDGGSFILRGMSETEANAVELRVQGVVAAALEGTPPDEKRAARDAVTVYQDELLSKSLLHPAKARAKAIIAQAPGVWPDLYAARDELNRGRRAALGKGAARS